MTTPVHLRPGLKLHSSACETELIVIRAETNTAVNLTCGGAPMRAEKVSAEARLPLDPQAAAGTALGKRYVDAESKIELLCTHAGAGTLAIDGQALVVKAAKPLPASD